MKTYTVTEKQNINSTREGTTITAANLSAAKRKASRMQCFHGTVMTIENESGSLLSSKTGSRWTNHD
jgi:ribosomal protein L19